MGKFSHLPTLQPNEVITTIEGEILNAEGSSAFRLSPVSELFARLSTGFIEDKFYESTSLQLEILRSLIKDAIAENVESVFQMILWARKQGNMRSAPIMAACEYLAVGAPNSRQLINEVCVRADEPAEALGYWLATYGRPIPSRLKRGLSDACQRLYTERNALKWNSSNVKVRMADVVSLCHCKPKNEKQSDLYYWLIKDSTPADSLVMLNARNTLMQLSNEQRLEVSTEELQRAGFTWESYSSYINGPMNRQAWEKMLPTLGYMAMIRNLRNFEDADISPEYTKFVCDFISDPENVKNSRQLPFRFYSALQATNTYRFSAALELAFEHVFSNVPQMKGRTLILIDSSGSMTQTPYSSRSVVTPAELASIFGVALASSCEGYDLVQFANDSITIDIGNKSIAKAVEQVTNLGHGIVGHGTELFSAINKNYEAHERIVILSDMQDMHGFFTNSYMSLFEPIPVYMWDLAGYGTAPSRIGARHYMFSGISDKVFDMIANIENLHHGIMPWDHAKKG